MFATRGPGLAAGRIINLRLRIQDPFLGLAYSLQNKQNEPIGQVIAEEGSLSFDVPIRVAPGPKFYGEFVRREGASSRFIYIAIGKHAGQLSSEWNRRAKIDMHLLSYELIEQALPGGILEVDLPGKAEDGGPACATLRPLSAWRVVE